MGTKEKKHVITQEDIMKLLDSCYEKCLNGIPKVSPGVKDMAADYLKNIIQQKGRAGQCCETRL